MMVENNSFVLSAESSIIRVSNIFLLAHCHLICICNLLRNFPRQTIIFCKTHYWYTNMIIISRKTGLEVQILELEYSLEFWSARMKIIRTKIIRTKILLTPIFFMCRSSNTKKY